MAEFRVLPSLNTDLAETNALYVSPADATTPMSRWDALFTSASPIRTWRAVPSV